MSAKDIQEILSEMYGFKRSPSLISKITDRILPEIEEWRSKAVKGDVYYKAREENQVRNKGSICSG